MNIDQTTLISNIGRLSSLPAAGSSISSNIPKASESSYAQPPIRSVGLDMGPLGEIDAPAPIVNDAVPSDGGTAVLASESGSGSLNVKMGTSIYVLNHSFDEQKGVLELIA